MKTKQTNKLLVLIISVMMIATLFVGLSITASAEETGADTTTLAAEISGKQVNLGGDISMKYYVKINDSSVTPDQLKLVVTFLGTQTELTSYSTNTETGEYIFTFDSIPPQCMGDDIDAELYIGENAEPTDSVLDYSVADNLVSTFNKSGDSNLKLLILDTLEYGAAAQIYRDYKTNDLVSAPLIELIASDIDKEPPQSSPVVNETVTGSIGQATVHFSTVNYIKMTYTDGGTDVELSSETIAAYDFAKKMQFSVDGLFSLQYSINDYCYDAYTDTKTTDEMKALAKDLYNYGLSAHIVKGNHTGGTANCAEQAVCTICGNGYGEKLEHNYSYVADDDANTITASCDQGCEYKSVVTLVAPTNPVYNGKVQDATVSGEIVGKEITVTYADDKTPINAGEYTASITVDAKTVSVTYTIAKATPEYTIPTDLSVYVGQTLNDIDLPSGWTWHPDAEPDFVFTSDHAGNKEAVAIYTPEDTLNYNTIEEGIPFTVLLLPIDGATVTVSSTVYNGEVQTPNGNHVTVIVNGKTLVHNTDYYIGGPGDVEFINAGTYTITIGGQGNYTGSIEATFIIEKATVTVEAAAQTKTYGGADPALTYTAVGLIGEDKLTGELSRAAGEDVGTYAITQGALDAGDNYTINFSGAVLTIIEKDASGATVTLGEYNSVYDGNAKTPDVTVTLDGKTLEKDKDYTVTYIDNLYVGTATVTITFKGNYEGVATKTFEITQDPKTTEFDGEWVTIPTNTEE